MIARSKVNPWLLWMVIAHARRMGYCRKVPSTSSVISFVCGFRLYLLFVHSSGEHRYYNGMIGLVTAVSKDGIRVKGNGESQDFLLETEEWTLA